MKSRQFQLLAVVFALMIGPIFAGHAAEPIDTKNRGPVDVELPPIIAPMVIAQRLESYAYITVSLTPANLNQTFLIREKIPFLRDAFLRELNKGTIVKGDDPKAIDVAAVKERLETRMKQILPAGSVTALKLAPIVVAPLQGQ